MEIKSHNLKEIDIKILQVIFSIKACHLLHTGHTRLGTDFCKSNHFNTCNFVENLVEPFFFMNYLNKWKI